MEHTSVNENDGEDQVEAPMSASLQALCRRAYGASYPKTSREDVLAVIDELKAEAQKEENRAHLSTIEEYMARMGTLISLNDAIKEMQEKKGRLGLEKDGFKAL